MRKPTGLAALLTLLLMACADRPASPTRQAPPAELPPCDPGAPFLHKGLVVGSWTPRDDAAFDESWLDEADLVQAFTKERVGRRSWRGFTSGDAALKIDALLDDREGPAVGYLFSLVARASLDRTAADVDAVLHVRHRGRLTAWLDGRLVLDEAAPDDGTWGEVRTLVRLTGPYDVLLLKLGRGSPALGGSMNVEVRLSDLGGSPLDGQTWNTMRPPGLPTDL
jgi:hypothetical protein